MENKNNTSGLKCPNPKCGCHFNICPVTNGNAKLCPLCQTKMLAFSSLGGGGVDDGGEGLKE